jgi:photosystem II stability/assembly factor-like uncharacterized protein
MRLQIATGWRSLLLSTLLCTSSLAKKDAPSVHISKFDFIPVAVSYFDDSDVMLFEDRIGKTTYRSDNAGEDWKPVDAGKGQMFSTYMHPIDNKRAYIIGEGNTHWMTKDRGKSWDEFKTDSMASLFRPALTFHYGDPDRVIFNAMDCAGIFCEEIVSFGW